MAISGLSVSFTVTATGVNLLYQWQKDGVDIAGATSAAYTISSVTESDEGEYRCVVFNDAGVVTSNAANLIVCKYLCAWYKYSQTDIIIFSLLAQ